MKNPVISGKWLVASKKICLFFFPLCALCVSLSAIVLTTADARGQISSNKLFVLGTNNVLPPNETNFFNANSNLLNAAIAPQTLPALHSATNLTVYGSNGMPALELYPLSTNQEDMLSVREVGDLETFWVNSSGQFFFDSGWGYSDGAGDLTAASFTGDGSGLTNIPSSAIVFNPWMMTNFPSTATATYYTNNWGRNATVSILFSNTSSSAGQNQLCVSIYKTNPTFQFIIQMPNSFYHTASYISNTVNFDLLPGLVFSMQTPGAAISFMTNVVVLK